MKGVFVVVVTTVVSLGFAIVVVKVDVGIELKGGVVKFHHINGVCFEAVGVRTLIQGDQ